MPMIDAEFTCCVPCAAPLPEISDAGRLRDWTEISIRPVFEVRCPTHGVLGHAVRADEARRVRNAHWHDLHATRPAAAT